MEEVPKNRFYCKLIGLIIFIFWIGDSMVLSQNLIRNPSFELFDRCPTNVSEIGQALPAFDWLISKKSSPDYFNACSKFNVGVPVNFMGQVFARDGNAYIGLVLTEKPDNIKQGKRPLNYRESISSELAGPLVKDSLYKISLYYCIAPHSTYALNSLSAVIGKDKRSIKKHDKSLIHEFIDTVNFNIETGVWFELDGNFIATGEEKYIAIGNFLKDGEFKYQALDLDGLPNSIRQVISENQLAYYFIDHIKIEMINTDDENKTVKRHFRK